MSQLDPAYAGQLSTFYVHLYYQDNPGSVKENMTGKYDFLFRLILTIIVITYQNYMPEKIHPLVLSKKEIKNAAPGQIFISAEEINESLQKIAPVIAKDYTGQELTLVGVLKGACLVIADLERLLYKTGLKKVEINFVQIKSYLSGTQSSHQPMLTSKIDFDPKNKNILLVDDIIDTGLTLKFLHELLIKKGTASVRSFTLVSKPRRREVKFEPDYVCFEIPNVWIEGYGMDTNGLGRNNPDIIIGPAL